MDLAAFGDAQLTVWSGTLEEGKSISWTQEFTMTTSNNGYCAAFRAGGDVDRNGYPDMTLVEKEGSWPSDQNHLKCFKETTPYSGATLRPVFPHGKEVFRQGSVQFADWISAVPVTSTSLVQIDYSLQGTLGPWTTMTAGTANSGRYQWIIPQTISSNNCFLRYTLIEGSDTLTALTPEAFTILGDDGIVADFIADKTEVYPDSMIRFMDQSLGLITSWEWDFNNDGTVDAIIRNPSYAYSEPGLYTVKLTVSDGISSQTEIKTDYIFVIPHIAMDEIAAKQEWFVFPNPCSGWLTLRCCISMHNDDPGTSGQANEYVIFELFEISGKKVEWFMREVNISGTFENILDISHLREGVYFYRIQTGKHVMTGKLIKNK